MTGQALGADADAGLDGETGHDLVVATLPGVQLFIGESRSTSDLYAGSAILSRLAEAMRGVVPDADVVMPARVTTTGMPNRVVALTPAGRGRELAGEMTRAAHQAWRQYDPASEAVGFPVVQWVVVASSPGGYAEQWERAGAALAARKRIRDFTFAPVAASRICSLTGRWPAVVYATDHARRADRVRGDEEVSAVGRAKRRFAQDVASGFPSTWSIASAPYRGSVISLGERDEPSRSAVANLQTALDLLVEGLPGRGRDSVRRGNGTLAGLGRSQDESLRWLRECEGSWCVPETWDGERIRRDHELSQPIDPETVSLGRSSAAELERAHRAGLGRAGRRTAMAALTPYLAVVAQDADRMGELLAPLPGRVTGPLREWHGQVSEALVRAAEAERRVVEEECLGRVVYAGGDDLLALVPVAHALDAARAASDSFRAAVESVLPKATTSSAVVFFHASWPLQSAIAAARRLLKVAKEGEPGQGRPGGNRPGLAVEVLRRGGLRCRTVLPWYDRHDGGRTPMVDRLTELARAFAHPATGALSARLAAGLEHDAPELSRLEHRWLERELARRATRHGAGDGAARALRGLCVARGGYLSVPTGAVGVARFIASQASVSLGGGSG